MQEHWPTGILLWAIGALAGWWLLRGWPQLAISALLIPLWLVGEWVEAVPRDMPILPAAFCTLLALCYLSIRTPLLEARDSACARTFAWIGGIALFPCVLVLALGDRLNTSYPVLASLGVAGWIGVFLLPLGFAFIYRRAQTWMNLVAALWVLVPMAFPFERALFGSLSGARSAPPE